MTLRLWPHNRACAEARHAVRGFCDDHQLEHLAWDAELLTSELVTNALKHVGGIVTLVAICRQGSLVVVIRDDAATATLSVNRREEPAAEGGRGLQLVSQLAGIWGIRRHADGKSVWFRLP